MDVGKTPSCALPVSLSIGQRPAVLRQSGPPRAGVEDRKEKVYEYEPNGVGSCHSEAGCVGLISSPTAKHESAFLDASENGNDVFFLTAERLVQQDVDESFDVYDARVCEPSSPCLTAPAAGSPPCEETVENPCRGPAVGHEETFPPPASTTSSGSGNLPQQQVLSVKVAVTPPPPPKPLTRAQQLAKALKVCKADKKKSKRVACESRARKKYGPKTAAKAKKAPGRGREDDLPAIPPHPRLLTSRSGGDERSAGGVGGSDTGVRRRGSQRPVLEARISPGAD